MLELKNAWGWVYNTLQEIFSDSKMIPDLLHLGCSDSPNFTYSTISKSSENPRTFIDSDIKYLHFRFRIQYLGRRDENRWFSSPFFSNLLRICVWKRKNESGTSSSSVNLASNEEQRKVEICTCIVQIWKVDVWTVVIGPLESSEILCS